MFEVFLKLKALKKFKEMIQKQEILQDAFWFNVDFNDFLIAANDHFYFFIGALKDGFVLHNIIGKIISDTN